MTGGVRRLSPSRKPSKLSQTKLSDRPGDVAHAFSVLCRAFEPDIPESIVNSSPGQSTSPLFSPRGEAKCVRRPSVGGARRLARGGVLEQYGEHGNQAQRSNGGLLTCFGRQVVRKAG